MELTDLLKKADLFKSLPDEAIKQVVNELKTRTVKTGEVLFNLGDPGDELIVVQQGKISIYMPDANKPQMGQAIRIFNPGEILGEMALIDQKPRSASARAEVDSVIATLGVESFKHLIESRPEVAIDLMGGLNGKIRYTTNFIGEMAKAVKLVGEGKYQEIHVPEDVEDSSLSTLAADFVRMAAKVQEREEKLQQEVAQLRIEIDEVKRHQEVKQITGSEYYVNLKEKLKALREAED